MMKRLTLALALALAALALPAAALAKGPSQAKIEGPGLKGAVIVKGNGESSGSRLGDLAMESGFFPGVFDTAPDPMLTERPQGDLGPMYRVTYLVPGPNGDSRLEQELYPYAKPYPVSYVRRGQTFWDGQKTHGGWFLASLDLKTTAVQLGLPARAPKAKSASSGFPTTALAIAAAILLVLAALAFGGRRRLATIGPWARSRSTSTT